MNDLLNKSTDELAYHTLPKEFDFMNEMYSSSSKHLTLFIRSICKGHHYGRQLYPSLGTMSRSRVKWGQQIQWQNLHTVCNVHGFAILTLNAVDEFLIKQAFSVKRYPPPMMACLWLMACLCMKVFMFMCNWPTNLNFFAQDQGVWRKLRQIKK